MYKLFIITIITANCFKLAVLMTRTILLALFRAWVKTNKLYSKRPLTNTLFVAASIRRTSKSSSTMLPTEICLRWMRSSSSKMTTGQLGWTRKNICPSPLPSRQWEFMITSCNLTWTLLRSTPTPSEFWCERWECTWHPNTTCFRKKSNTSGKEFYCTHEWTWRLGKCFFGLLKLNLVLI